MIAMRAWTAVAALIMSIGTCWGSVSTEVQNTFDLQRVIRDGGTGFDWAIIFPARAFIGPLGRDDGREWRIVGIPVDAGLGIVHASDYSRRGALEVRYRGSGQVIVNKLPAGHNGPILTLVSHGLFATFPVFAHGFGSDVPAIRRFEGTGIQPNMSAGMPDVMQREFKVYFLPVERFWLVSISNPDARYFDPWALFCLHFIQRATKNAPLSNTNKHAAASENSHPYSGIGGPIYSALLCLALLFAGAAGIKKNLYNLLNYSPPHHSLLSTALLVASGAVTMAGTDSF